MSDLRAMLKESAQRLSEEERAELEGLVMELWRETLTATKGQLVKGVFECRGCGKQNLVEVPVQMPDIATRAKAFEIFANQAYGKPQESRTLTIDVGERTLEEMRRMSTAELARMAGVEVIDGEVRELEEGE